MPATTSGSKSKVAAEERDRAAKHVKVNYPPQHVLLRQRQSAPRALWPTSEFPMSASLGRPTAVPCARTVRQRPGTSLSASVVGVSATWTALYSSFTLFSPQPSRMQTSTGASGLESVACGASGAMSGMLFGDLFSASLTKCRRTGCKCPALLYVASVALVWTENFTIVDRNICCYILLICSTLLLHSFTTLMSTLLFEAVHNTAEGTMTYLEASLCYIPILSRVSSATPQLFKQHEHYGS